MPRHLLRSDRAPFLRYPDDDVLPPVVRYFLFFSGSGRMRATVSIGSVEQLSIEAVYARCKNISDHIITRSTQWHVELPV